LADPNVKRVGTRGQRQRGVDIIGKRNRDSKQPVGIQCKLKSAGRKLTDDEVKDEVRKALTFRPKLTDYFIVTTSKDDTELDELGKQLSQDQEAKGRKIHIEIWGWDTLSDEINQSEAAKEAFDPGFSPSIGEQTRKLDAILAGQQQLPTHQDLAALAEEIRETASDVPTKLPPQFADRELKDGLSRALRRRGFGGADTAAELAALADRAIDGDLSFGNDQLRAEICDRAARSNFAVDRGARSRRLRSCAGRLDPARDLYITDALIKEAEGDPDQILRCLRWRSDIQTRSAFFMALLRQRGRDAALEWIESENLSPSGLDAWTALNLVHSRVLSERFEEALTAIAQVPQPYFNECPALIMLRAQLMLASMLPADQKSTFFHGLPANPKTLQLASGSESEEKLAAANSDIDRLLGLLGTLGLANFESCLSELDLWLRLERPATGGAARQQLAKEIADPEKTLQRVRLALAYGVPFNQDALQRHLASRKELGGWTPDERHVAFLIAYHSSDPKRMAEFFDQNHDDLFAQSDLNRTGLAAGAVRGVVGIEGGVVSGC
jgi:hypothetical protein